nr:DUF3959 family protein [Bacillus sp. 165]
MLLSFLFLAGGILKQIPMELSVWIGGLLFLTSVGSYLAKQTGLRIFSWISYTLFSAFLLSIWDQYVTLDSLTANIKIAACISIIPFLLRFRTYAITLSLLSLWGALIWDIKETQSFTVLSGIMNMYTTEQIYAVVLLGGFLIGGWIGRAAASKTEKKQKKKEKKQKRNRQKLTISVPKLTIPKVTFRPKPSVSKNTHENLQNHEEHTIVFNPKHIEKQDMVGQGTKGETRMERRKKRNHT